jgi:predicted nucleic acid-binding protein
LTVLDTNIFIYVANDTLSTNIFDTIEVAYATVSKIEALGFTGITAVEQRRLEQFFYESIQCELDGPIIEYAIGLRQQQRIGLGDAIIAATAMAYDCELWTADTADFGKIDGLRLVNPLEGLRK